MTSKTLILVFTIYLAECSLGLDESLSCECGIPNGRSRIVGGQEADINEYPWMVTVLSKSSGGTELCGGSIISPNYILTAAHCVTDSSKKVTIHVGGHDISNPIPGSYSIEGKKTIMHPEYKTSNLIFATYYRNDIALIELSKPVKFDKNGKVRPVCLPKPEMSKTNFGKVKVAGWGKTTPGGKSSSVLKEVELDAISNAECISKYDYNHINIEESNICVKNKGNGACHGDSGGPLMWLSSGKIYQIGLVSWVKYGQCAAPTIPGVYTRITSYLDWIESVVKREKFCKNIYAGSKNGDSDNIDSNDEPPKRGSRNNGNRRRNRIPFLPFIG